MSCGAHLPRILSLSAGPESCKQELKNELMLGDGYVHGSLLGDGYVHGSLLGDDYVHGSLLAVPMFAVTTGCK